MFESITLFYQSILLKPIIFRCFSRKSNQLFCYVVYVFTEIRKCGEITPQPQLLYHSINCSYYTSPRYCQQDLKLCQGVSVVQFHEAAKQKILLSNLLGLARTDRGTFHSKWYLNGVLDGHLFLLSNRCCAQQVFVAL